MENNSELNNRAAQYTLCFNAQCSKAESCLRHSMTQYNTAQNARLSVINPLCYPAAGKKHSFQQESNVWMIPVLGLKGKERNIFH